MPKSDVVFGSDLTTPNYAYIDCHVFKELLRRNRYLHNDNTGQITTEYVFSFAQITNQCVINKCTKRNHETQFYHFWTAVHDMI